MALIIPYTFVAGTYAKAAEVNDNFTAVKAAIDELQNLYEVLQSDVTILQQQIKINTES